MSWIGVKCQKWGKTTWAGCGLHKDMVMAKVLEAESNGSTLPEEGQFKLTYPAGYMTKCTLPKVLVDQVEVTCVLEEQLHDYV